MKMKSNSLRLLAVLLTTCFLVGCTGTKYNKVSKELRNCPEGYVYDYQVSMEPIPEEITALGDPCQGTIHAFPSKIGMALTELEMEKDPVLKEEVEKRIPEIEAALEEEIGGEFAVDGVIVDGEGFDWTFFCTELETGYQFDLGYANKEYHAKITNDKWLTENVISVEDYYKKETSIEIQEELVPIVKEIYQNSNIKVQTQGYDIVDIVIAQYADEEVDKCLQQENLLMLWEKLMEYDKEVHYNLSLAFYPYEYEALINEKYNTYIRYDFGKVFNKETVRRWGDKSEILACFRYVGISDKKDAENMNVLLQQSKEENYNKEKIWEYWIY